VYLWSLIPVNLGKIRDKREYFNVFHVIFIDKHVFSLYNEHGPRPRGGGHERKAETMTHNAFFNPLEKVFRFYAGLYLAIILFLPAYFLSDTFLPFSVSGWRLGAVELARLLLPQAFGFAALILAFLTHQYGILLKERSLMKAELDLTI